MKRLDPFEAEPSMAERVAASLREAITSLDLRPGEAIVEGNVARQLGVSTTPVREALHRLAKDGLVVLNRYRGARVANMTARDVREIFQLREVLEPLAAELALPRFTDADLAVMHERIEGAAHAMARSDWGELSRCNRRFHGMFIARCGNERLRHTLENLQDQNRIIALLTWEKRGHETQEHEEHLAVLDAVQQRKAELAAARLRQHIVRFGQSIFDLWSDDSAQPPGAMDGRPRRARRLAIDHRTT
jgi:DNA-binding GntR family transcriptional regulator